MYAPAPAPAAARIPAQRATPAVSTSIRSPRAGNERVTRVAQTAARIATGTAAPAPARPAAASADRGAPTCAARRPARAASHRNPIVRAIGTKRAWIVVESVAVRRIGGPSTVASTSARSDRRAVRRPIFTHDQNPYTPIRKSPSPASSWPTAIEGDERDRAPHRGPADDPPGVGEPPRTPGGRRRAHPRRSATRSATCEGLRPTDAPTASRASALAAAVPLDPVTIAPAWPIRLPGGASKPAR